MPVSNQGFTSFKSREMVCKNSRWIYNECSASSYIFIAVRLFRVSLITEDGDILLAEGDDDTTLTVDDQLPTPSPTRSTPPVQPSTSIGSGTQIEVSVVIDDFPEEVHWKLLDFSGRNVIDSMQPGFYTDPGAWISTLDDLKDDSLYTFVITESKGRSNGEFCDGLLCCYRMNDTKR